MGNKTPYIFLTYIWGKIPHMGNFTPWGFLMPPWGFGGVFHGVIFPSLFPMGFVLLTSNISKTS